VGYFAVMTVPDGDSPVEQALTGGTLQAVGWYRFYFADERWEWSPEVEQIHGYQPGTATPTTQLVLSHKHPDDYHYIAATLDDIRRTRKPLSTRHRIITVQAKPATSSSSVNGCTTTTPAK
jgi:PAS fold